MSSIALAHHADDQVELFFLRLLRGAGGEGLAGMKWRSPSSADKQIMLVRPLLGCAKTELLAFVRENQIRFRADASNASADFLRNRIRNELLPLLQKNYQPGLKKTVLRLMEITGAEAELTSKIARDWRATVGGAVGGGIKTASQPATGPCGFAQLPVAVQRQVLQQQVLDHGLVSDFDLIEQLRQAPEKWVTVSPGLAVARDLAGKLGVRKPLPKKFNADNATLKIAGRAGQGEFVGRKFFWQIQLAGKTILPRKTAGAEFFDADRVGGKIILRHWRAGDRFQPIGLNASVKLQDLFVNAKISVARRHELVLATTAAGEIFWVEGLRISDQFKLTPVTTRRLLWRF
jgi:tRNA(Ile)-lysidine synthase